ncbi:MAG: maleylpyruvate isomerase N-terminal domain-containing protein [Chloroflexales bacterium]|nr:maleylpyruvate isomerase N-terminal domain-containing protein [Chloroflexales bacterium]
MNEDYTDDITQATVAEFLRRLDRGRVALDAVIEPLSERQLTTPDPIALWSVKDHLAHLAVWANGMTALLKREPRYPAMGVDVATAQANEMDQLNDMFYRQHKDRPLGEVRAFFDQSHRDIRAAVAALDDADLQRTYSYFQPDEPGKDDGTPIVAYLVGNSFGHYEEHTPWINKTLERIG